MEKKYKEIGINALELITLELNRKNNTVDPDEIVKVIGNLIAYFYEMGRIIDKDNYMKIVELEAAIKEAASEAIIKNAASVAVSSDLLKIPKDGPLAN